MSRNRIILLISIMAITLMGLILLMNQWIANAFQIQKNQFVNQVNQALGEVSRKLETRETIYQIQNQVISFKPDLPDSMSHEEAYANFWNIDQVRDGANNVVIQSEKAHQRDSSTIIILGDSVIFQTNPGQKREIRDFARRALAPGLNISPELQDKIRNKTTFVEKVVNQMLRFERSLRSRVTQEGLDSLIRQELKFQGISQGFEFAVVGTNKVLMLQSPGFRLEEEQAHFQISLYPNDFFNDPSSLLLYFPGSSFSLFNSLGLLTFSTLFLTLVVLVIFGFSVYIIVHQKRLSEIRTDFINNMTHELKTPIATISLATQMLRDKTVNSGTAMVEQVSGIIDQETKRLQMQVEKVLQMAVFEKGDIALKATKVDLCEMVEKASAGFGLLLKQKKGTLSFDREGGPAWVMGDAYHLSSMISNLIDNSLKYNQRAPEIRLRVRKMKGEVELTVADNGIGISPGDQKRIFEKFYRVPTGNLHNVKGFGLGLSYVRLMVEKHQGSLSVESELGKGSVFTLRFPDPGDSAT